MAEIKAVSFDLWDTMIKDDSDEARRQALGLRSKSEARRHLVFKALNRTTPIDGAQVGLAYDVADAAFNKVWHDHHVTWPIAVRLELVLDGLARKLSERAMLELIEAHEEMELQVPPDAVDGIEACPSRRTGETLQPWRRLGYHRFARP